MIAEELYAPDALLFADSARILRAPEIDSSEALDCLRPLPAHGSTRDGFLTIHRPNAPPQHVSVSPYFTPHDVHLHLQSLGLVTSHGMAWPLDFSPVQGSNGAHFLALDSSHAIHASRWVVFDLRRVAHPPLVTFWAMQLSHQATLEHLCDVLYDAFPSLDPIINIYSGLYRVTEGIPAASTSVALVTVMGASRDQQRTGRPAEPALFCSTAALLLRPGFMSAALREARARRRVWTVDPSTSSTTSGGPGILQTSALSTATVTLAPEAWRVAPHPGSSSACGSPESGAEPCVAVADVTDGATPATAIAPAPPCMLPDAVCPHRSSRPLLQDIVHLQTVPPGTRRYFTIFDPELQTRVVERRSEWGTRECLTEASRLSRHLPLPHRLYILARPLPHFPAPQVVISAFQAPVVSRTVPIDLRPIGRPVSCMDLSFGAPVFTGLLQHRERCASGNAHTLAARGDVLLRAHGAVIDAFQPVSPEVETIQVHSDSPLSSPTRHSAGTVPRGSGGGMDAGEAGAVDLDL